MKTKFFQNLMAGAVVTGMTLSAATALAQDSSAPAPQLAYGVSQILQLTQAKVGDDTIVSYIKNSGNSYGLNADQIIYLRQQGVSSAVITTMLNQPKPGVLAAGPAASVPQPTTAAPAVTYVQSQPSTVYYSEPATTYYYYQPYYYPYYSYPYYYGWYPGVSLSFGWGGRFGGWYGGGFRGGGFRGGGFRGGGFSGGFHGGGFHGGRR
jgi:uncharacterized membrane protein YgcG